MVIGIIAGVVAIFGNLSISVADIIDHQLNGYLAKPFDTSDLAAGIDWVLSNENRHKELCLKAREKADCLTEFVSGG